MDAQKVDAFIMANGKFFPDYQVAAIRDMLLAADDSKWSMLQVMQFKDPTICLIISLFAGSLGIISPTVSSMAVRLADGTCTGTDGTMGVRAIDCATGTGWGV